MILSSTHRSDDAAARARMPVHGTFEIRAFWPKQPIFVDRHLDSEIELPAARPSPEPVMGGTIH